MGQLRDIGTDVINTSGEAENVAVNAVETADIQDLAVTNGKVALPKLVTYQETVAVGDFTDGESTSGTIELDVSIPVGAVFAQSMIDTVTGFAGDTSAVITIGDGTDVDRYNTGTPDVFTTATAISAGAPSGTAFHSTAKTPTVTITTATDFGLAVTDGSGEATITLMWYQAV